MSRVLRSGEVAKLLGIHPNSVTNWARQGKLRDIRVPGTGEARFDEDEVLAIANGGAPLGNGEYHDGYKAGRRELSRMLRNMAAETDPDYEDVTAQVYTNVRIGYGFLLAALIEETQSDREKLFDSAVEELAKAMELLEKSRPVITIKEDA